MGIDMRAAIFVGLPREEFSDLEGLQAMLDAGALDVAPPHYDGNNEDHAIVGFKFARSERYGASPLTWDIDELERKAAEFKKLTGMDGKVWITPYIY